MENKTYSEEDFKKILALLLNGDIANRKLAYSILEFGWTSGLSNFFVVNTQIENFKYFVSNDKDWASNFTITSDVYNAWENITSDLNKDEYVKFHPSDVHYIFTDEDSFSYVFKHIKPQYLQEYVERISLMYKYKHYFYFTPNIENEPLVKLSLEQTLSDFLSTYNTQPFKEVILHLQTDDDISPNGYLKFKRFLQSVHEVFKNYNIRRIAIVAPIVEYTSLLENGYDYTKITKSEYEKYKKTLFYIFDFMRDNRMIFANLNYGNTDRPNIIDLSSNLTNEDLLKLFFAKTPNLI